MFYKCHVILRGVYICQVRFMSCGILISARKMKYEQFINKFVIRCYTLPIFGIFFLESQFLLLLSQHNI